MGYESVDPTADERTMLLAWLDFHRATLERKCDRLETEQLRRHSVPPSSLTLLGLLRHMADVERHWFRRVYRAERVPPLYWTRENPDADFTDVTATTGPEALAAWRAEVAAARAAVADSHDLSVIAARGHRGKAGERPEYRVSLRWILIHMIEEYARHNGHADLLREAIDGETGL